MTFTPRQFRDQNQPGATDWGNIFVFILMVLAMGWAFDRFVMQPHEQALRAAAQAEKSAEATVGETAQTPAPRPRTEVMADTPRLQIENDHVTASIALARGRVDSLTLKDHTTKLHNNTPIALFEPVGTDHAVVSETGWLARDTAQKLPDANTLWQSAGVNGRTATLTWDNGTGLTFTRVIELDDKYMIQITDTVANNTGTPIVMWPYAFINQHGIPEGMQSGIVHEGAIGYIGKTYVEEGYKAWGKLPENKWVTDAKNGWLGITSRYFFVGLIPEQVDETVYRVAYKPVEDTTDKNAQAHYQVDAQGPDRTVAAGATNTVTTHIFAGGKELRMLEAYEKKLGLVHFDLVLDFGWFYFLTKPFYYALVYLNDYIGNFGVAIIVLTALLRLAVFPLASTSFRSFAKMKVIQPKIQEIQKEYSHDKRRMQEEIVKLYQKERVNPLSGCLPVLAQIPIFFAIYKVINVAIETRHAPFFGWIHDLSAPDPTSLFNLYGLLPYGVPDYLHFGVWPSVLFVLIMIQVRLSPPQQDKMFMIFFNYYYPVVVTFIMSKFAAGLVIYWVFSSFFSLVQQMYIMRSVGTPIHILENLPWSKAKQPAPDVVLDHAPVADQPAPDHPLPDHVKGKKKSK